MVRKENAKRWWRLSLTVLFAGILLPLFGMTAHASAAGWSSTALAAAVPAGAEQDDNGGNDGENLGGGDDNGGHHGDGREFKGIVEVMPDGAPFGPWTISSKVYTVTEQTEISEKYGTIEIGTCVGGEWSADETYVRELKSTRELVCKPGSGDSGGDNGGDDGEGRGELYAKLVSFPPELTGDWVIGSLTFKADANTEFSEKNGPFTLEKFVKVEFVILEDGTFLAKEIKTVGVAHDDDDGPGHGHGHDHEDIEHQAVAFGTIDSLPDGGGEGVWQVGGITYTVTISTELKARHGSFEMDRNVRVKYWVDEFGNRVARQIKSMPPAAGGNPERLFKLVGFVTDMPHEADGFIGEWTVGNVVLVADENSKFEEDDGVLAVDAFVEVKYRKDGTTRRIVAMETHVMPGGGDHNHIGKVEHMDDDLAGASTGASTAASAAWRIGGSDFVVTDATMVGNVAAGDTVLVNSYTDASGAQVATRISDVTLDSLLFLPTASR